MRQYLTARNIALALLVVSVCVLLLVLFSRSRPVQDNSAALRIMQVEIDSLKAQDKRHAASDSLLRVELDERKKADALILSNLKKQRDENINRIDRSDNDALRRILAE